MAYVKDTLIARRGYAGLGDDSAPWWQKLLGGAVTGAATQTQAQTQAAIDTQKALAAQGGGLDVTTVAIVGVLGFAAYKLIRRRKK